MRNSFIKGGVKNSKIEIALDIIVSAMNYGNILNLLFKN